MCVLLFTFDDIYTLLCVCVCNIHGSHITRTRAVLAGYQKPEGPLFHKLSFFLSLYNIQSTILCMCSGYILVVYMQRINSKPWQNRKRSEWNPSLRLDIEQPTKTKTAHVIHCSYFSPFLETSLAGKQFIAHLKKAKDILSLKTKVG